MIGRAEHRMGMAEVGMVEVVGVTGEVGMAEVGVVVGMANRMGNGKAVLV